MILISIHRYRYYCCNGSFVFNEYEVFDSATITITVDNTNGTNTNNWIRYHKTDTKVIFVRRCHSADGNCSPDTIENYYYLLLLMLLARPSLLSLSLLFTIFIIKFQYNKKWRFQRVNFIAFSLLCWNETFVYFDAMKQRLMQSSLRMNASQHSIFKDTIFIILYSLGAFVHS